ncbi:amidohydrolase family protein [Actinocrinis puniceicyclus]|uniref:Amidohydrolase family protein n=1 Tax=Actinocrinis puniceicyclus TaxID=977794 RepID=A0A8J8BD69_9ACTN|nr:amidohydrolase family protein [Actinocrinis puniceicyclus]MBS2965887.1 amidohydrolase family protein [Actinocrinis puniceicyclus]
MNRTPGAPAGPTGPAALTTRGDAAAAAAVIDSHLHFWDPRRLSYPWLGEAPALNRALTAEDLVRSGCAPAGAIFMEAGRSPQQAQEEISWIRHEARRNPWILGAVAHVPLEHQGRTAAALRHHADDPFVVGVRRNLQDEADGFTADACFRAGIRTLGEVSLPFDACVREHQLPELARLAAACPQTTIIVDHLGKPRSAFGCGESSWRQDLRRLAGLDNVVCKLSGLMTEVAPDATRPSLVAVLREALDAFGPGRCMYGSDWPVMTLATSYEDWLDLVRTALAAYPAQDAAAVLHDNATRIYRLDYAASALSPARKEHP